MFTVPAILFFVGVALFIGLLHTEKNLILLSLMVLAVTGGAKIWGWFSLSGIGCSVLVNRERIFPGEAVTFSIHAENTKFLPVWLQILIPGVKGDNFGFLAGETSFSRDTPLLWYQRASFQWNLIAKKRGVNSIGPLRLQTGDLLGFFSQQRLEPCPEIIVYPRIIPLKSLPLAGRDLFGIPGTNSPVLDPVYLAGTRDYQQRQPARYIHWKASARHGRLQEKVFSPSNQKKILLMVDVEGFSDEETQEEFEQMLEVTASLAASFERQGFGVGLVTNGVLNGPYTGIVPVSRNAQSLPAILEVLARLRKEASRSLPSILKNSYSLPWGVSCLVFTFQADSNTMATHHYLMHHHVPTLYLVSRQKDDIETLGKQMDGKIYLCDDLRMKAYC